MCLFTCVNVYVVICVSMCIFICVYVYIHVCAYIYVCEYGHICATKHRGRVGPHLPLCSEIVLVQHSIPQSHWPVNI